MVNSELGYAVDHYHGALIARSDRDDIRVVEGESSASFASDWVFLGHQSCLANTMS